MKRIIFPLLALVLLAGCATTGNRPHPYDRDSKQVKCKVCGQWYDGKPIKVDMETAAADPEHLSVCPKCGRAMPEAAKAKGTDWEWLGKAISAAEYIMFGIYALVLAGFLALALG